MTQDNEYTEVDTEQAGTMLPAIADNSLVAIANQVEKRFDAMGKIKRIALKITNPHDWVDQNGKPYLQASGAEKVARLFGISWRISEPALDNLEGGHYSYTYKGEFSLSGTTIEAIGTRSSKDPFFRKYSYQGDKRVELPASEIDRGDVKKSAYTNLLANGITRLLGIRNLTYDDLAEYAGITRDKITSVEYKKGSKPATGQQSNTSDLASEPQVKAIHTMLGKLKIADDMAKCEKVKQILALAETPTSITKLTKSQASTVIESLKKEMPQ